MDDVTIIVHPSQVDDFRRNIDLAIRHGKRSEVFLREEGDDSKPEALEDDRRQVRIGKLAEQVKCLGPRPIPDDPNPEVEFRGDREVMIDLAGSMMLEAIGRIQGEMRALEKWADDPDDSVGTDRVRTIRSEADWLDIWTDEVGTLSSGAMAA